MYLLLLLPMYLFIIIIIVVTWSVSHSRVHVLMASTHKLGFMSLGQIPACE